MMNVTNSNFREDLVAFCVFKFCWAWSVLVKLGLAWPGFFQALSGSLVLEGAKTKPMIAQNSMKCKAITALNHNFYEHPFIDPKPTKNSNLATILHIKPYP